MLRSMRNLLLGAALALSIGHAPAFAACDPTQFSGQNTAQYQQLKTICENQGGAPGTGGPSAAQIGATNESAAATDTSTSGLNGLLKRIAQRLSSLITAVGTPMQQSGGSVQLAAGSAAVGSVTLGAGAASVGNVGGKTVTVCVAPTVTNATYSANNNVGGLITFASLFQSTGSGILQSVTVNFKTAQTVGFVFFPFSANPSNSTWTEHGAAAINAADVFKVRSPIQLASPKSNLGTHTVYAATGLGQPWVTGSTSGWGVLVPEATTASLGGTSDVVEICATVLQDL